MEGVLPPGLRLPGPEDLSALAARIPGAALHVSHDARERYARDESTRLFHLPTAVVEAREEAHVAQVLAWAHAGRFPVVPRGAGTGVAGGSVATLGGVVLSLERMNRLLEIDEENLTATCEPGLVTRRLQEEVERRGLFYPPDPASSDTCSIGGNAAVGAGGPRAVKYGTTRDYVLGLRVALADGDIVELGGKNVKDATGYHLMELLLGSEGTLGVITRLTLRLVPLPARSVCLLLPFPTLTDAARAVSATIRRRIVPAYAEFMDDVAIAAAQAHLGRSLPLADRAGAYVFVGLDGESAEELSEGMRRVAETAREHGALDALAAEDPGQQERLLESRRTLADALKRKSPVLGKADVVVPRAAVPELVARVKRVAADLGVAVACFGHAGDGNVHVNVLREALDDAAWDALWPRAREGILDAVRDLSGRPSGEHGLGALKRAEGARFLGPRVAALQRAVKDAFDPLGILNPGKVLE